MMQHKKKWMFAFPLIALLFLGVGGWVTQQLWNYVTPAISDGLKPIDYWHAVGLLVLTRLLVGFKGGPGKGGHRAPWAEAARRRSMLKNMTPEQRERFREEWRRRCAGPWGKHMPPMGPPPPSEQNQ